MLDDPLRLRPLRGLSGILYAFLCLTLASSTAAASLEPFAASPAELLALAAAAQETQDDVVVLDHRRGLRFDDAGRLTRIDYLVYVVRTTAGVQGWDSVSQTWAPWHEERPEIRARVVRSDGGASWLDPAHLSEDPVGDDAAKIYDDRRILAGPLPAMDRGTVVEQETVVREHRPWFEAGRSGRMYLHFGVPIERGRITIEAPASTPLRHRLELLGEIEARVESDDAKQRVILDYGPLESREPPPPSLPPDVPRAAHLAWSTGESWGALARAYSEVVEARLAEADLEARARELTEGAADDDERIARLLAEVHRQVRYTGLELGEASIVPVAPTVALERGFGDCKDKATLLVGLLRAAGIPAHVALLKASYGSEVPPDLPGLGLFNHAIVQIPGDEAAAAIWIDATSPYSRAGELPPADQHRWALVASPETTDLLRTPLDEPSANEMVLEQIVTFADLGHGDLVETTTYRGVFELDRRSELEGDAAARRKLYAEAIESMGGGELEAVEETAPDDLSQPSRLHLEIRAMKTVETHLDGIVYSLQIGDLFDELSPALLEDTDTPRDAPFMHHEPFVMEWRWTFHAPVGMEVDTAPKPGLTELGVASLERHIEASSDGPTTVVYRFASGPAMLSAEEFEATRSALVGLGAEPVDSIYWRPVSDIHLQNGESRQAIDHLRSRIEAEPDEAAHRIRLSVALLKIGQGRAAREAARTAARLAPESPDAHWAVGNALSHDLAGRQFYEGFDRAGAIEAYERAIELRPDDRSATGNLAQILTFGDDGVPYGDRSSLERAVSLIRTWRETHDSTALDLPLLQSLLHSGNFEALEETARELPSSDEADALRLAAVAINHGADAVPAEAAEITATAERQVALQHQASVELMALRRYELALAVAQKFAAAHSRPAAITTYLDMLSKARRIDELEIDPEDPAAPFWRLLVALTGTESPDLATILHPRLIGSEEQEHAMLELLDALVPAEAKRVQRDLAMFEVGLTSFMVVERDSVGDDVWLEFSATGMDFNLDLFVQGHEGTPLLRAVDDQWTEIARRALEALDAAEATDAPSPRDPEASDDAATGPPPPRDVAETWLRWAAKRLGESSEIRYDDPLSGSPFLAWWGRGGRRLEDLRTAAHLLAMSDLAADEDPLDGTIDVLRSAASRDDLAPAMAGRLRFATAIALLQRDRLEAGRSELTDLLEDFPRSDELWQSLALAHHEDGDVEGARTALDRWLEVRPDSDRVRRIRGELLAAMGPAEAAIAAFEDLAERGLIDSNTFNNLAWFHLFAEPFDAEEAAHWMDKATRRQQEGLGYATLHTIAAVLAETDRPLQAYQALLQAMNVRGGEAIEPGDWFVLGQIAEAHDLHDAARHAYERALEDADADADADETTDEAAPDTELGSWSRTRVLAERNLDRLSPSTPRLEAASPTS